MASTAFVLCALLVIGSAAAQRGWWTVVETDDDTYVSLVKIALNEFWLRPSCLITNATVSLQCGRRPELLLRVELWTRDGLRRARRALIDKGHCRSRASCRVLPFQAVRFGVRDQDGRWEAAQPWTFPAGPLPSHQRFRLRTPKGTKSPTAANCTDFTRSLTPPERAQLESLFVEIVSVSKVPGGDQERSTNVSFTQDNVRWAAKRLGLRLRSSTTVLDRGSLRKLALSLLRMKKNLMESLDSQLSFIITRNSVRSLEMALVAHSAPYSADMRSLLAQERRPAIGEVAYALKIGQPAYSFSIVVPADPINHRLRISAQLLVQVPTREEVRSRFKNDSSVYTAESSIIKNLRQQLDKAISTLHTHSKKIQSLETSQVIKKRFNISTDEARFSDLVIVKDCEEVQKRRLPEGVYLVTAINRFVRCGADGSLVTLRRSLGKVNFDRDWKDYVEGFGDARIGDYWIGLRHLASLTREASRCAKFRMRAVEDPGRIRTALYSGFQVAGERNKFRLSYNAFKGDYIQDGLSVSNGQLFSTKDRDHDLFPLNCAKLLKGGGWYRSCYGANLFAPLIYPLGSAPDLGTVRNNSHVEGMCWPGITRKDKCQLLMSLEMEIKSFGGTTSNLTVVLSKIGGCKQGEGCKSLLRHFMITSTGRYVITAGGGNGGFGSYGNFMSTGGRGAIVRAEAFLKKGTELGIVVGCGGRHIGSAGSGGNATWVVDRSRRVLLLVAGGGGGAAKRVSGLHGRASETAMDSWYTACDKKPTTQLLLQRHFPNNGGLGWTNVQERLLGAEGTVVGTGSRAYAEMAGGGGGGYRGGGRGTGDDNPGGGGASYCNRTIVSKCKSEEGGNVYGNGWLLIQKYGCF